MSLSVSHLEDYLLPDQQTVQEMFADETEAFERLQDHFRDVEDDAWMLRVPEDHVMHHHF